MRTFAEHVSEGMVPNRLPDGGEQTEYNTVDATLWFFVAVHAYLTATDDVELAGELMPTLIAIVDAHRRGTRYRIRVDPDDELLDAGEPGVQLTWMDAKVGDWVVTPRKGTVWPWLLGPFATAHYRVHGDATLARTFLTSMESHLLDAGVGSISEIFDGDPPHGARGCFAQAWSVAEVLRAWTDLST